MENLCVRCARLRLGPRSGNSQRYRIGTVRGFSTSRTAYDKGSSKPSPPISRPLSASGQSLRSTLTRKTPSAVRQPPNVLRRSTGPRTQNAGAGPGSRPPPPGLLQRKGGAPVIRRTSDERSKGGSRTSTSERREPGTDKRVRRASERRQSEEAEQEDEQEFVNVDAEADNYIQTVVDPPENPQKELPHVPGQEMSVQELRADWPTTPLSAAGLTESVQQRIEWLAHRLPHGYSSPDQLAKWYVKGNFTRFESEEEKEKVMILARERAQRYADWLTEENSVETAPQDMTFNDLVSRSKEKQGLADAYVRGVYPETKKQSVPFLDHIARNLNNNVTYASEKTGQFMNTIQRLAQRQPQSGQAQDQK